MKDIDNIILVHDLVRHNDEVFISYFLKMLKCDYYTGDREPIPNDRNATPFRMCYLNNKLFGVMTVSAIIIYSMDSLLTSNRIDVHPFDISVWKGDSVIVLGHGKHNNKIFHVFNEEGVLIRSFGNEPEKHHRRLGPRNFFVYGDTIYVGGTLNYNIYKYVNEELVDTIKPPQDEDYIYGPVWNKRKDGYSVAIRGGISGMGIYDNKLYVTTFHHEILEDGEEGKKRSTYFVDAFDLKTKRRIFHKKRDVITILLYADWAGLYMLIEDNIKQWRGIDDNYITL